MVDEVEASPDSIFISYSRADGREFAEAFERRLEHEGIRSWRDLKSMEAGDIRPQVLRAIENAGHFVLILSRRALTSDWIKREWSHARMMGKRVSPVLADPVLNRADLQPWMRREEVFDIDPERDRDEERWKALVLVLRSDGRMKRAPYMPGDLPADFVPRPTEYTALKAAVAEAPEKTVALTTTLRGAGGYGKTTLANFLCRDPDVRFEFCDGIARVEVGKERDDITGLISDLIEKLAPEGKRPGFTDVVTASEHLGELIGEARLLLVIDDVWREAQLRPFLRGGPNCVRLVTTRLPYVLKALRHTEVLIDEMRAAEAARLITTNLPVVGEPGTAARLANLAVRLGNWAQMLAIANGWLCDRVGRRERLVDAIARFERRLAKDGPFVFDPKDETQRNRAIRLCIVASVEDLDAAEAMRFGELAILPEDENVPLSVIEALWAETGEVDEDGTDDLVRRLDALSLLQSLDLGARTLRVHDNIIWYLRDKIGAEGCRAAHAALVQAMEARCGGGRWETLPSADTYGWRFLIRHLRGAGRDEEADRLLTNYAWIKAKLRASAAPGLFDSYLPEGQDEGVRLVGRTIALSLPALAVNPQELPRQLFGRLGGLAHEAVAGLVASAQQDPDFRPAPRWPGLTPPGAERLRLVGHRELVCSAYFSPDGARIVTASGDRTARLWDATTGQEILALRGHEDGVSSAYFSPDGTRILTASSDRTARLWDATTGQEILALRGHDGSLYDASFSPDEARIVTASDDRTARLWDATIGQEILSLRGHEDSVSSAYFSPDGARILTASSDRTARLWDATTGQEVLALLGHQDSVRSASFSPDGARIVTASDDSTARLWDATTGREIIALRHDMVFDASFSSDGARIVTASVDCTARLWDATTGQEIIALRGHDFAVSSASFSRDGTRILTASVDRTARLWDVSTDQQIITPRGHEDRVWSASFSSDGERILTASSDHTARLWDATTGQEMLALRGHEDSVSSASFSPDGARILTTSSDRTARLWDATTGQEIMALRGHEGEVRSASFSPDGARILTASCDGTARLWDATTGQEMLALRGHEHWLWSASFSPDGARIVTASRDRTARLWDATTGEEVLALRGHERMVSSASFSPDGARVVTASSDCTARLWDATTGGEILVLRSHGGEVSSVGFSPDGARIVTTCSDRLVRLWNATTGKEITRIVLDASAHGLSVYRDTIALGDALGRIHVFEAEEFLTAKGSASG
jgi:WD40 repeat protein